MAQNETVDRILNAATILFAERGFAETSLRTITGMADVNLASVNYHFGSKKELIQAVFTRFMTPFCRELDRRLDDYEHAGEQPPNPDVLLRHLFAAFKAVTEEINEPPQRFMKLLGLAYSQSQEHLRLSIIEQFGGTYTRFTHALKGSLPEMSNVTFYWRLYFMLGAAVFTLSSYDSIRGILNADYHEDTALDAAIELMIPSLVGMLNVGD